MQCEDQRRATTMESFLKSEARQLPEAKAGYARRNNQQRSAWMSVRTLAWWAAKWEQMHVTRRRNKVKATATAPLLPPTPSTPHATLAVDTSPMLPCSTMSFETTTKAPAECKYYRTSWWAAQGSMASFMLALHPDRSWPRACLQNDL